MSKMKIAAIVMSLFIGVTAFVPVAQVAAQSPADQIQNGVNQVGGSEAGTSGSFTSMIKTAINILLFLIGAVAVLMIVFGGLKYVTSRGDATEVTSAKNTILYAVIGLVVAILAYATVEFVVDSLSSSGGGTNSSGTQNEKQKGVGPTPF